MVFQRVATFVTNNKKGVAQLIVGCTVGGLGLFSLKRIPTGHVGVVENWHGQIKPFVFSDSQMVICVPFYEKMIPVRILPVKKRYVKRVETADGEEVMARLVTKIQAKVHWVPELYLTFGKDYGRAFLEQEASQDLVNAAKNYTKDELINGPDELQDKIQDEVRLRLSDAAESNMLKLSPEETTIVFVEV